MSIESKARKKGKVYYVRWMRNGKRCCKSFKRFYDAKQFETEVKEFDLTSENSAMTFQKASEEWIAKHAEIRKAESSIMMDKNMLRNNILPYLGHLKLGNIRPHHIENCIAVLKRDRGLSNSTINRNLDAIRAILNHFYKCRAIYFNPMMAVNRLRVDKNKDNFWSMKEAKQFLEYTEKKYWNTESYAIHLFYLLALNTGMRLGELLSLRWSDIDFDTGFIAVGRSYSGHSRKINNTTKSHKVRHVALNSVIKPVLKDISAKYCNNELVLMRGNAVLDPHNLRQRYFQKDIAESGVKRIRIHDLRHTFASHFMMNSGNIYALSVILGHSTIKMTERYAHYSKVFLKDKINVVSFSANDNIVKVDFNKAATS